MAFFDLLFGSRDPGVWNVRGAELQRNGDFRGAISAFTKAINLDPRFAAAYLNRGFARYSSQDFKNAIFDFSRAIELAPTSLAYHDRGMARFSSGDIEGSIADCERAIELNPGDGQLYFGRGLARLESGKLDAALEDFNKSMARRHAVRRQPSKTLSVTSSSCPNSRGRTDQECRNGRKLVSQSKYVKRPRVRRETPVHWVWGPRRHSPVTSIPVPGAIHSPAAAERTYARSRRDRLPNRVEHSQFLVRGLSPKK